MRALRIEPKKPFSYQEEDGWFERLQCDLATVFGRIEGTAVDQGGIGRWSTRRLRIAINTTEETSAISQPVSARTAFAVLSIAEKNHCAHTGLESRDTTSYGDTS